TECNKQPIRLILDTNLRTPISSNVVTDHLTNTWIFAGKHVDASLINQLNQFKEAEAFQLDTSAIALVDVLTILHNRELRSVYVDVGATVDASFVPEGLIDEVHTYLAPILIGGATSLTSFQGKGVERLADAFQLEIKEIKQIGQDLKIISRGVN